MKDKNLQRIEQIKYEVSVVDENIRRVSVEQDVLSARVVELETENQLLKDKIAELEKKIADTTANKTNNTEKTIGDTHYTPHEYKVLFLHHLDGGYTK